MVEGSIWRHLLVWSVLVIVALPAIWFGLPTEHGIRRAVFEETRPIRFRDDMQRGFGWGHAALNEGYLGLYDRMANQSPYDPVWLDYAPLRLAVMTTWARINASRFPEQTSYVNTFDFAAPVLWFNSIIELITAAGIFALVRHWRIRAALSPPRRYHGVFAGLIGALIFWFNPAVLISAHGWATWDVWVLPFFLWAVYLACINRWFTAGLLVAIGAMFKGQILTVSIVLIVWPLVMGQWRGALRVIGGIVFGIGMVVSPWMVRSIGGGVNGWAIGWLSLVFLSMAGATVWLVRTSRWRRGYLPLLGGIAGLALLLCMPICGASDGWYQCGWRYGTRHFNQLIVGLPNNLGALLFKKFAFNNKADIDVNYVVFSIGSHVVILKTLLQAIFILITLVCGAAAGWHARRNDPRFLVAILLPWLAFFAIPLQIHERYLLFFSASAACFVAVGPGTTVLGILLSLLSAISTINVLLKPQRLFDYQAEHPTSWFVTDGNGAWLREITMGFHPDSAWGVLLCVLVFLYLSLTPSRSISSLMRQAEPVETSNAMPIGATDPHPARRLHRQDAGQADH